MSRSVDTLLSEATRAWRARALLLWARSRTRDCISSLPRRSIGEASERHARRESRGAGGGGRFSANGAASGARRLESELGEWRSALHLFLQAIFRRCFTSSDRKLARSCPPRLSLKETRASPSFPSPPPPLLRVLGRGYTTRFISCNSSVVSTSRDSRLQTNEFLFYLILLIRDELYSRKKKRGEEFFLSVTRFLRLLCMSHQPRRSLARFVLLQVEGRRYQLPPRYDYTPASNKLRKVNLPFLFHFR